MTSPLLDYQNTCINRMEWWFTSPIELVVGFIIIGWVVVKSLWVDYG